MDESNNQFTEDEIIHLYSRFKSFDYANDGRIGIRDILKVRLELNGNDSHLPYRLNSFFSTPGIGVILALLSIKFNFFDPGV